MRGRKLTLVPYLITKSEKCLDKRVPVRGRKPVFVNKFFYRVYGLDKRVPVRGRKPVIPLSEFVMPYRLDKRVPVRGRKLVFISPYAII